MQVLLPLILLVALAGCAPMDDPNAVSPEEGEPPGGPTSPGPKGDAAGASTGEPPDQVPRLSGTPAGLGGQPGSRYHSQLREAALRSAGTRKEPGFWEELLPELRLEAPDQRQVQTFIRFYRNNQAYLDRAFERGQPFLPYILNEVEKRALPPDLALLPLVESAFRPFAYSPGRAAGIWQFTPGTGRHFDLKQNWWYDGRRDILAATDAALDYLEELETRYGSWELALAAYNAGPGTVSAAIRRNRARNQPTGFWNLPLPRETRSYVPKLLALSHVLRNAEQYGLDLPPVPSKQGFAVVELDAPLDLTRASELADVDIERLYRLNPGLNRWATPPNGPNRLLVPPEAAERFRNRLAELSRDDRMRWTRHRIKSGQTLAQIADRYRTTVSVLKRVNRIPDDTIRAGEHLIIPTASSEGEDYPLSLPQRLAEIRNNGPDGRTRIVHEVNRGESLWEIARRFNVELERLAEWNGMAPGDTLRSGQRLAVWVPKGRASGDSESTRLRYRVREGDSLWTIAREFNVPLQRLRSWNGLGQERLIHPGDRLTIYVDPTHLAEHRG